jgi:two-component system sensor histidine kinase KdpD
VSRSPLPPRRRALGWLLGLGGLALLTVVLANLRSTIELPTVLVIFLGLVVTTAAVGGRLPAFVAAVGGFLSANWYFTPPFHRLAIADAEHAVALVVSLGVAALVSHFVDAAAHRRLEAERARSETRRAQVLAEANELRTALLQAVSHDLRTPLASVKASISSLLQEDVTWSKAETGEFLATISEETDRLIALVTNLLDMSRIQAGVVQPAWEAVGLEEVVPAALASLGPAAGAVDAELDETLPPVRADAVLLERALANVVGNAARYTPPGGRVRVEADATPGRVAVRVIDHGSGIPAVDRELVFQPFQRRDDHHTGNGVGLGLAVARGFVNAMGGTIEIDDTPGGGTTVVISLPVAPGPERETTLPRQPGGLVGP